MKSVQKTRQQNKNGNGLNTNLVKKKKEQGNFEVQGERHHYEQAKKNTHGRTLNKLTKINGRT